MLGKVQNIRVAAKVKSYTQSIIPVPSPEWENQKAKVMVEMCPLSARQSDKYYQALIDTGNDRLVHNMEVDPCWGFGRDGKIQNLLGKIKENVRSILQSEGNDLHWETNGKRNNNEVTVISNSILSGAQTYLLELDIKSNSSFSGKGASFIVIKVRDITAEKKPKYIVLHISNNSIEHDDFQLVETAFRKAISDVKWTSQDIKIILSGLMHRIVRTDLHYTIDFVNNLLQSLETNTVTFINNFIKPVKHFEFLTAKESRGTEQLYI